MSLFGPAVECLECSEPCIYRDENGRPIHVLCGVGEKRPGRQHSNAGETERESAEAITPVSGELRSRVYFILKRSPKPLDRFQIAEAAHISLQSACARVDELKKLGVVRVAGSHRRSNGRRVEVLEAV